MLAINFMVFFESKFVRFTSVFSQYENNWSVISWQMCFAVLDDALCLPLGFSHVTSADNRYKSTDWRSFDQTSLLADCDGLWSRPLFDPRLELISINAKVTSFPLQKWISTFERNISTILKQLPTSTISHFTSSGFYSLLRTRIQDFVAGAGFWIFYEFWICHQGVGVLSVCCRIRCSRSLAAIIDRILSCCRGFCRRVRRLLMAAIPAVKVVEPIRKEKSKTFQVFFEFTMRKKIMMFIK